MKRKNIKVGMLVTVKPRPHEPTITASWVSDMEDFIGGTFEVLHIDQDGDVLLSNTGVAGDGWYFSPEWLKRADKSAESEQPAEAVPEVIEIDMPEHPRITVDVRLSTGDPVLHQGEDDIYLTFEAAEQIVAAIKKLQGVK